MKGKLLINQSYNTIVLDSIVLKPNTSVKVSLEDYDRLIFLTELKDYINIGYIITYDTTIPDKKINKKEKDKKEEKDKVAQEDNKINTSENNTIPTENITTNSVYNTHSENTIDDNVISETDSISEKVEIKEPTFATEEPKVKRRGGRRKKK